MRYYWEDLEDKAYFIPVKEYPWFCLLRSYFAKNAKDVNEQFTAEMCRIKFHAMFDQYETSEPRPKGLINFLFGVKR